MVTVDMQLPPPVHCTRLMVSAANTVCEQQ
jgi:hypothetical protein